MSKSILLSIKPRFVADILNGRKTIEVRKVAPKCDLPIDVYIYCTKGKPYLGYEKHWCKYHLYNSLKDLDQYGVLATPSNILCALQDYGVATNGHIIAKFTLNKVEKFYDFDDDLCEKACIDRGELLEYLGNKDGYAWHIENLEIFDGPIELDSNPPMSWCYIER